MAAEVLPDDVLGPAGHHVLIAEVEGVLEVQERGHQSDRQARSACCADPGAHDGQGRAKEIVALNRLADARLARKRRCQRRLDLHPGQPVRQHRQRVPRVDHLIQPGAEKNRRSPWGSLSNSLRFR